MSDKFDIYDRALKFAAKTAMFVDSLPFKQSAKEYGKQLIRSSASVGANLQEADGAVSKKDFVNKMAIVRKEAKETYYWLTLIKETQLIESEKELMFLLSESRELKLILSSIINKTKAKDT